MIVVGDLHLGSSHCRYQAFERLLDSLPAPCVLVANGDTIDHPGLELPAAALAILERLGDAARFSPVFIRGNHDETDSLLADRGFAVVDRLAIPARQLLICHGDVFHTLRSHHRWFIRTFHLLHRLRVGLGAPPIHVAQYAKHWRRFYRVLRNSVRDNAIQYAAENGFRTIVCGHVHCAEDTTRDGVRYLNSGCWTEAPSHYLDLRDNQIVLREWP